MDRHVEFAKTSLRIGVVAGLILTVLQIFPTGDRSAHDVAVNQPSAFAAMEGMFVTQEHAPLVIIGNPNTEERRLFGARTMLWTLMLAFPFTYIANIAGWTTAETGRQPWAVYGLLRTEHGASPAESVPAGTRLFTLIGFSGLYMFMGLLFVVLMLRIVNGGPEQTELPTTSTAAAAGPG